jgi:Zn finger protein HypA/HybF involved in hydrogenase expression
MSILNQDEPISCFNCEAEFTIDTPDNEPPSFCPFCGSELFEIEEDDDLDDDLNIFDEQ